MVEREKEKDRKRDMYSFNIGQLPSEVLLRKATLLEVDDGHRDEVLVGDPAAPVLESTPKNYFVRNCN